MSRMTTILIAACVSVMLGSGVTYASLDAHAAGKHKKKAPAKVHGLAAPHLVSPDNGAAVQQLPALTWNAVSGAATYQYEVAVDPHFHSLIVVSAAGRGTPSTHDLAASLENTQIDGTYYWRVRAVSAGGRPGPWSATRSIRKTWTVQPQLDTPAEDAQINWPATPLVLHWSEVPYALEYIVTIATDEKLSNIVLGTVSSPIKTEGTTLAPTNTLQAGQTYYWAITPVDAGGHRGARSMIHKFTWSWPTTTSTSVNPLNEPVGRKYNWTPELSWAPIPGAARYQVEVNVAESFAAGSSWFSGSTIGTSTTPEFAINSELVPALNSNEYYWRVRAIDASGNAGVWNEGPRFTKGFDHSTPTIPNLEVVNIAGNPAPESVHGDPTTETPLIKWSAVPGAASYEVRVEPYDAKTGSCGPAKVFFTSSLAWTPNGSGEKIEQSYWPRPQEPANLSDGTSYCVAVAAFAAKDAFGKPIASSLTEIPGLAFTYETRYKRCETAAKKEEEAEQRIEEAEGLEKEGQAVKASEKRAQADELDKEATAIYNAYETIKRSECPGLIEARTNGPAPKPTTQQPAEGSSNLRTPLFTWLPVPGATEYYVAISRNEEFTNLVDLAKTQGNAYAPPIGNEEPLDDETTEYFWAVYPVTKGGAYVGRFRTNGIHVFEKASTPPALVAPAEGEEITSQPTFKWSPVSGETSEGALSYTLEVASDPSFSNPIDEVTTDSTAYTSSSTYPAHQTLYWRVRANDTNLVRAHAKLQWSARRTFKRALPAPQPLSNNPTSGEAIPALEFTPVTGAVGYSVHVEEADGTVKDFSSRSPVFTAIGWRGPGNFRFSERAEYPTVGSSTVPGSYSAPITFAHTVAPPAHAAGVKSGGRIVITWSPQAYAKHYDVAISTSETFASTIDSQQVGTTSWAPNVDFSRAANRKTLYWRVAAVDTDANVGPFATGIFRAPKAHCKTKRVKRKGKTVRVCVAQSRTKAKRGTHR